MKVWDMTTSQCVLTMDLLWAMGTSNTWSDWMTETEDQSYVGGLQFWQYALCSGTVDGALRMWDRKWLFVSSKLQSFVLVNFWLISPGLISFGS